MNKLFYLKFRRFFLFSFCLLSLSTEAFWEKWLLPFQTNKKFYLTTEDYPPFNMLVKEKDEQGNHQPKVSGLCTEIIQELFKRLNLDSTLIFLPWQQAYDFALTKEDHAVFSTTQTKERMKLFKWVGPLVSNRWVLLAKNNPTSSIVSKLSHLSSIEDLKGDFRIGGYDGDALALFLEKKGIQLDLVKEDALNARRLEEGKIDLWATGHLVGPYFAKREKTSMFQEVLSFKTTQLFLAFNRKTEDKLITQLNAELEKMHQDGTILKMELKYLE